MPNAIRTLTIGPDGNATADTGEHIGAVAHVGRLWSFLGKGGVEIVTNTPAAMRFELSTAYAAHIKGDVPE